MKPIDYDKAYEEGLDWEGKTEKSEDYDVKIYPDGEFLGDLSSINDDGSGLPVNYFGKWK